MKTPFAFVCLAAWVVITPPRSSAQSDPPPPAPPPPSSTGPGLVLGDGTNVPSAPRPGGPTPPTLRSPTNQNPAARIAAPMSNRVAGGAFPASSATGRGPMTNLPPRFAAPASQPVLGGVSPSSVASGAVTGRIGSASSAPFVTNRPTLGGTNLVVGRSNVALPAFPPTAPGTNLAGIGPTNLLPRPTFPRATNVTAATPAAPGVPPTLPPPGASAAPPAAPGLGVMSTNPPTDLSRTNMIGFQGMQLDQVLAYYSELTGRTVLRPANLPPVSITLKTVDYLSNEEAIQALDSVLTLNGITMIPVGTKFVTAVPTQQAMTEGAVFSDLVHDEMPEAGQYLTKIVQLKYAESTDLQQLLAGFAKNPNGILPVDRKTLVIRDYAANIKRMLEIIERVDIELDTDYKLEVIPIKYGKVEEIYSTMSSLIGGGGGGGMAAGVGGTRSRGAGGVGGMGARSGSRTSSRSRQLIGAQGRQQLGGQQQPGQFGQQAAAGAAGQQTFAQRLQGVVGRAGGAGSVELLGDARIVPDERSNSLIVFAAKEDMQMITNIVSKVDRLLAQVLIEGIIMNVELSDSMEFGVSALMNPQKTGNLSSVAGMGNGPSFLSGVTNMSSVPGGFTYWGKYGGDMDVAAKALAYSSRGEVLQTPRVQTSHAIPASFFSGKTVPYVTSSYYGGYGYGPSSSFQQLEVGIGLNVTPYITPDGLVVMDIEQTIEDISGYTEITGVGKVPNTVRRTAGATVSVQDGDTILLGGYINTSKSKSNSGVPVLKDIPLLGNLFKSHSRDTARSELVVMLRPTVLPTPHDAALIAKAEESRLPGIRQMEKEMRDEEVKRQEKSDKATGRKKSKK